MIEVRQSTSAAAEDLWRLVGDLERWGEVLPTVQRVTRLGGDGSTRPGDRFEVRQPGLPKAVYEVTDWAPPHEFTWVSRAGVVTTTASHRLEPAGGGTELVLGLEWTGPLGWLANLLYRGKARRMIEQEADTFVRLAEHAERRE
jgi:carbon monoxide dehydrogenase subunit G